MACACINYCSLPFYLLKSVLNHKRLITVLCHRTTYPPVVWKPMEETILLQLHHWLIFWQEFSNQGPVVQN